MNFSQMMLIALVVTGAVCLADRLTAAKKRAPGAKLPLLVEYSKSFFPVILVVFLLRSFLAEPFKIPSGSMMPTLLSGDFILVNKFGYGLREPLRNTVVVPVGKPQRGDVVVFQYPENPSIDFIKRVVGVPGDTVSYRDKVLSVNGQTVPARLLGDYSYARAGMNFVTAQRYQEHLGRAVHDTLVQADEPTVHLGDVDAFPGRENCAYDAHGFVCKVPAGHYFALGDNRDDSRDSRYWGFIPDNYLIGRAFLIWWNFDQMRRIGTVIH